MWEAPSTLLVGAPAGITKVDRLTGGGATFEDDVLDEGVKCLYAASAALGGALYACERSGPVWRSPDGAPGSWQPLGRLDPDEPSLHSLSLFEVPAPPGAAAPVRLVAAALGGIATSDDGGLTWDRSSMWQIFRYWAEGRIGQAPDPEHPFGGTLYAGVRDFGLGYPTVYASGDGGSTWELRSGGPQMTERRFDWGTLAVDRTGGVWLGTSLNSGPDFTRGRVLWSGDGARTWTEVSEGLVEASVNELVVGRDGRVWAATDKGVWRTVEPLYATAEEGSPEVGPAAGGALGARVWPNPSDGAATVEIEMPEAQSVRVSVVDALGREVALLHEGPLGSHQRLALDTAAWPVGTYLVRAVSASGQVATSVLTVAR